MTDVPVTIFKPGTQDIDVQIALDTVQDRVQRMLPGAYFNLMVFSGKCQDFPQLRGKLVLVFVQVSPAIPRPRVVKAVASIDTVQQTMDLHLKDVSDNYPSTRHRRLSDDPPFKEVSDIAHGHITKLGLVDCDVTITQLDDNSWDVRCGPLHNFVQQCHFEIVTGEVRDIEE